MHRATLLLLLAASIWLPGAAAAEPTLEYRVQEPIYCAYAAGCPRLRRNAVSHARTFCQEEGGLQKGERLRDFRCTQSGIYCVVTGRIECNGRIDPTQVPGVPGGGAAPREPPTTTCLDAECTRFVDHAPGHRELGVHACRSGFVMIGLSGEGNDLVCEALHSPRHETRIEGGTARQGLLACPPGQFLIGVSEDRSRLLCASLGRRPGRERVQDETGNLGLQVCEQDADQPVFLTGIDAAREKLLCAAPK
jgi:hypothetical protein